MVEIGYTEMHKLIEDGCTAHDYAWEHYEELKSRKTVYTLYGPPVYGLGVLAAGHLTPAKKRKLQKNNKRERYNQYELDENFHLLRVRHMKRYDQIDCTYHLFELKGVTYARPFLQDSKVLYPANTIATKSSEGRPLYYALTAHNYLCVDFYEYPQPDRVCTTGYLYFPKSKYTSTGMLASWEAPLGAQNSPVTVEYCEEEYQHIDFAEYFR